MSEAQVVDVDQVEELREVEVDPDLVFTTPPKPHLATSTEDQRTVPLKLDGQVYYLIKPRKWEDTLLALEESSARRVSRAERLVIGRNFLQTVFTPESLFRLASRAQDDQDDFEWLDLFDLLPKIIRTLAAKDADAQAEKPAKQPARARARTRTGA